MLKTATLVLIFFLSSFLGKAQQYVPLVVDSSHWFIVPFEQGFYPPPYSISEYFLYGDTVVSSVSYKKVFYRSETINSTAYSPLSSTFSLYALLREDTLNKKVYSILFQNISGSSCLLNQEVLLYDFDIQVGDTLKPANICHLFNDKRITDIVQGNAWLASKTYGFNTNAEELYEGIGSNYGLFEIIELPSGFLYPSLHDYCRGSISNCNSITTSIKRNEINNGITMFPNPFIDHFTISTNENIKFEYQVLSLNGKILERGVTQSNISIPINLDKGIYIIKILSIDKTIITTRKLIKLQ